MKLNCNVEVINRSIQNVSRRKAQKSCLAIGKQSVKNPELYLLLQTTQNKQGTKYKIDDNIQQVFTKFIDQGKTTIRLNEPPHDLIIQSQDPIQLKSFLHVLKLGVGKKLDVSVLSVSNLIPKTLPQPRKTKVVIKTKSDYPVLEGFPRTTEELTIIGLERKSFDRGILRLQSLRILNLSNNYIKSLPKELGNLSHLNELIVSNNLLGLGEVNKWTWLNQKNLSKNLRLLDLSGNQLQNLPNQIGKLLNLLTLKISDNKLKNLPLSIGVLPTLKYLDVSRNEITALPGSMRGLRLESISVSDNLLMLDNQTMSSIIGISSLTEFAAQVVLKHRMSYDASTIPFTLVNYLDNASFCVCGTAVFDIFYRKIVSMDLKRIANVVTSSGVTVVPFDCNFCSMKCIKQYLPEFY